MILLAEDTGDTSAFTVKLSPSFGQSDTEMIPTEGFSVSLIPCPAINTAGWFLSLQPNAHFENFAP